MKDRSDQKISNFEMEGILFIASIQIQEVLSLH